MASLPLAPANTGVSTRRRPSRFLARRGRSRSRRPLRPRGDENAVAENDPPDSGVRPASRPARLHRAVLAHREHGRCGAIAVDRPARGIDQFDHAEIGDAVRHRRVGLGERGSEVRAVTRAPAAAWSAKALVVVATAATRIARRIEVRISGSSLLRPPGAADVRTFRSAPETRQKGRQARPKIGRWRTRGARGRGWVERARVPAARSAGGSARWQSARPRPAEAAVRARPPAAACEPCRLDHAPDRRALGRGAAGDGSGGAAGVRRRAPQGARGRGGDAGYEDARLHPRGRSWGARSRPLRAAPRRGAGV